jgi:hypothetical protein
MGTQCLDLGSGPMRLTRLAFVTVIEARAQLLHSVNLLLFEL